MEFFVIIKEGRDIIDIVQTIAAIAIPVAALAVAIRGVKTWELDKITNIHAAIEQKLREILNYEVYQVSDEAHLNVLFTSLLDQLETLAIFIDKKYLLLDKQLKEQIFDDYIKYIYENKVTQKIIKQRREYKNSAYINFEKLYNKWNKK